jgi:hypothetical protein
MLKNAEPFYAIGELPAGSDAAKGFFFFGVPEGRALTICAASYWGGDTGENYQLIIVPASQNLNDVAIDGGVGMICIGSPAKGGGNDASYQGMWLNDGVMPSGNTLLAGPCSVVIASTNASPAAAFYSGVFGVMHDL